MITRLCRPGLAWVLLLWAWGPGATVAVAGAVEASTPGFALERVRWQSRVLVISAPDRDDPAFREQLAAVDASRARFEERDLLLVTLLDGPGSLAGDQALTGDEVVRVREALDIDGGAFALRLVGKDGGVKLSRNTVVPMDEIYALIDTMPMRRSEMQQRNSPGAATQNE